MEKKVSWGQFLWDVFLCALASYGGPEAHYGVYSKYLVEKKKYLTDEELTEFIGIYSLVPGPGSTQTITAIGYYVGGPILALLTFLVWAFPAIVIMSLFGVFYTYIDGNDTWKPLLTYLPHAAVAFIIFAAIRMTKKNISSTPTIGLYLVILVLNLFLRGKSIWIVPILLALSGIVWMLPHFKKKQKEKFSIEPNWVALGLLVLVAIVNEIASTHLDYSLIDIFTAFYRYGYSAMGGGQVVIPLMIQDLVDQQSLISLNDFLAGYAIDQAVPGPLFSFAGFVAARSFAGTGFSFVAGMLGGLAIFTPGIILVYVMFPLWHSMREHQLMKQFLKGVSIAVSSLVTVVALTSVWSLDASLAGYLVLLISSVGLYTGKIPAPLVIALAMGLGFIF